MGRADVECRIPATQGPRGPVHHPVSIAHTRSPRFGIVRTFPLLSKPSWGRGGRWGGERPEDAVSFPVKPYNFGILDPSGTTTAIRAFHSVSFAPRAVGHCAVGTAILS